MTDYYKIVAKRGRERERKFIGTEADILRFEKSGYTVTSEPTTEVPKVAPVVVKINEQATDIIAPRLIGKMKEELLVITDDPVDPETEP